MRFYLYLAQRAIAWSRYVEHEVREATHQVADAVSRDWCVHRLSDMRALIVYVNLSRACFQRMQRADVEMQLRLTTESEKVELEKQLGAMQRRLGE